MKIIHLVYSLEMGGAEILVAQLCRHQRAAGHEVRIFAYSKLGVVGESLRDEGFDIYIPGEAHPLKTMWRYWKLFRAQKPDVVHCHNVAPTIHGAIPGWLASIPRVISTRHRLELFPYDWKSEAQYNLMGWFCDWVAGICEATCINVRRGPFARKKKIVRVYNGTAPVRYIPESQNEKDGFTLVFVGRLAREKAIDVLIRAVARASATVPELRFWIVGDGECRKPWEALAAELHVQDRVRFCGLQRDTAPFFSAADVFVMSSIQEGLPMSLLQSMSLGTPAILTDVDGNGEILRLTESGILTPPGDVDAMANAIVQMATDSQLRETLSRRASEAYQQHFTLDRMAESYMVLYRSSQASTSV